MKTVDWNDFPAVCLELIDEVEVTGQTIEITKKGKPALRLMPVDEATRTQLAAKRQQQTGL
jgi:prevent-host-death family protein